VNPRAIEKEREMGPTQAEPMRIRLTYDEQSGGVTRDPADEFTVGELIEFYSTDGKPVKVILHPKTAYEPNTYDETKADKQPVRVVKAEPGKVWCYFEASAPRKPGGPVTWSERYGFDSDPRST
jgi:hypothetical protein